MSGQYVLLNILSFFFHHIYFYSICFILWRSSLVLSLVVTTFLWTPYIWFHSTLELVSMTSTTWILWATMDLHSPGGTNFSTLIPSIRNITQFRKLWRATDWQRYTHSHTLMLHHHPEQSFSLGLLCGLWLVWCFCIASCCTHSL